MSNLQKYLRIAILSLVVFSSLSVVSDSYAYWASNITGDATVDNATLTMGTWAAILQWDPAATYVIGDQVINNNTIYEAKKNNPSREPGVDGGWNSEWIVIGPA